MAFSCETCNYLVYDEEYEEYVCDVSIDIDEDDYGRLMQSGECPYYNSQTEYQIVKHQM